MIGRVVDAGYGLGADHVVRPDQGPLLEDLRGADRLPLLAQPATLPLTLHPGGEQRNYTGYGLTETFPLTLHPGGEQRNFTGYGDTPAYTAPCRRAAELYWIRSEGAAIPPTWAKFHKSPKLTPRCWEEEGAGGRTIFSLFPSMPTLPEVIVLLGDKVQVSLPFGKVEDVEP